MIKNFFKMLFQFDNKLPKNTNRKLGRKNTEGYTATLPDLIKHEDGLIMIRTDGKLYRLTMADKFMLFCRMISLDNFDRMICNN